MKTEWLEVESRPAWSLPIMPLSTAPSLHGAFLPCPCPLLYPCMGYSHHVPPTTTSLHGTSPPSASPVFLHGAFPPCPTYCSNPLPHAPPTALSYIEPSHCALRITLSPHALFPHALPTAKSLHEPFPACHAFPL